MEEKTWTITDTMNREVTIEDLLLEYPDLVAYQGGFEVDPDFLPEYGDERILFWACEEDSIDDDGARAVASAD